MACRPPRSSRRLAALPVATPRTRPCSVGGDGQTDRVSDDDTNDSSEAHRAPAAPFRGQITRVSGRNSETGGKGLPKVAEIEIAHDDGRTIEAKLPALLNVPTGTAKIVREIVFGRFPVCPICLTAAGETKEHVPPKPLGGSVMTYTCSACNGGLGSRTEAAMQDWFDVAFRISYTREGDPAHFGHNRVLYRETSEGEFLLLHEQGEKVSDALGDAFRAGGQVVSHQAWPHPNQYRTGLLKSAYLAACLSLRAVPPLESANEIRAELLAARDALSRAAVAMGERARSLKVWRTGRAASGPPLALVKTVPELSPTAEGGSAEPSQAGEYLISLAGTLLVSWPFPEIPATAQHEDFVERDS